MAKQNEISSIEKKCDGKMDNKLIYQKVAFYHGEPTAMYVYQFYCLEWPSGVQQFSSHRRILSNICIPNYQPFLSQRIKWQPTLVFLPRESQRGKSLPGYSSWGQKESDTSEQLSTATLHDNTQVTFSSKTTGYTVLSFVLSVPLLSTIFIFAFLNLSQSFLFNSVFSIRLLSL